MNLTSLSLRPILNFQKTSAAALGLLTCTVTALLPPLVHVLWAQSLAGIESGQSLHLEEEGGPAAAKDGVPGSLYVEVQVAADKVLNRRGPHIHVTIDVDFVDAILGTDAK